MYCVPNIFVVIVLEKLNRDFRILNGLKDYDYD